MPQLTFDKNICPQRVSITLRWDQLEDRFTWFAICSAQDESIQATASGNVAEGMQSIAIAFALAGGFEDWLDVTPGYAMAQLQKRMNQLDPQELPAGLIPHRRRRRGTGALGGD